MDPLEKVRKSYFDYMTYTASRMAEKYTPGDHIIVESAIRRYKAAIDVNYKALWEESEWLLSKATEHIIDQRTEISMLKREIENMKTYHGIPK
jgi:hypothetical protein